MGDSGTITLCVALCSRIKQTLVYDRRTQAELSQARDVEDLKKKGINTAFLLENCLNTVS